MTITRDLDDSAILTDIGRRLAVRRIDQGLTQLDLAARADVSKRTVERIEAGQSVQLSNLVSLLRELDLLDALDALLPTAGPRPMDLLRREGKTRQRVGKTRERADSKQRSTDTPLTDSTPAKRSGTWTWGDDESERS